MSKKKQFSSSPESKASANFSSQGSNSMAPPPFAISSESNTHSGDFLGYFVEEGDGGTRTVAKFRSTEGTIVSKSAKSMGLDSSYSQSDAFGAYVLEDKLFYREDGSQMMYPDEIEIGEIFSIVISEQCTMPGEQDDDINLKECFSGGDKEVPKPEATQSLASFIVDSVVPDMLSISLTGYLGASAQGVVGVEALGGLGGSANLIIDPTSPDFGKYSLNPHVQASLGGKVGAEGEGGPKMGLGLGLDVSEYSGAPKDALLENISGTSYAASLGIEGQEIIEGDLSASLGTSHPDENYNSWISLGGEGAAFVGPGVGISGELAGTVKQTGDGLVVDTLTPTERALHQKLLKLLE